MVGTMILFSYLSAEGYVTNLTYQDVAARNSNLFMPSSDSLIIWTFIYLLLVVFSLNQFSNSHKPITYQSGISRHIITYQLGYKLMISCGAQICWLAAWNLELLGLSVVFGIINFITVFFIMNAIEGANLRTRKKNFFLIPFSLYLGWLSISVTTDISAFFTQLFPQIDMVIQTSVYCVILFMLMFIAYWMLITQKNYMYIMAVLWGIGGLAFRHSATAEVPSWLYLYDMILFTMLVSSMVIATQRKKMIAPKLQRQF